MARDAIAFLDALDLAKVDLLDFSIGSFVAQEIALIRPSIVRRLVLASSAPRGRGRNARLGDRRQRRDRRTEDHPRFLDIFYTRSPASRHPGKQALARMLARTVDLDKPTLRKLDRPSTTRCAPGASRTTRRCRD
jgi:pimeloyl-ACP methyl ester carboxylesterase